MADQYGRYLTPDEAKSGQYSGKTVTIPGSGIRFKSVAIEQQATGTTPPSGSANAVINQNQTTDISNFGGDPTLRTAIDTAAKTFFEGLNSNPAPTPYNATDFYMSLRGDPTAEHPEGLGINTLEQQLTDLTAREKLIQQTGRERTGQNLDKPVAMGVIAGRQGEIDRQTNMALNDVAVQKAPLVQALQNKYSLVNTLMTLKQTDYQNTVTQYENQFNRAVSTINLLRGLNQDVIDAQTRARDAASANLTIISSAITNGNLDYNSLDDNTKANITRNEVAAGLPVGFISKIHSNSPSSEIVSTSTRVAPDGNSYADVILRDKKTGKITITHQLLGQVKSSGDGSGDGYTQSELRTYHDKLRSDMLDTANLGFIKYGQTTGKDVAANGQEVSDPNNYVSREEVARRLSAKYPMFTPDEIQAEVYNAYPDKTLTGK